MLETHEREIGGRRYVYQPLMLKPARALFDKLLQRFGPAISTGIEKLQDANLTEEMELGEALGNIAGSAAAFIQGIVTGLDPKTHAEISDIVAKQTMVQAEDDNTKLVPLSDLRELLFGRNLLTEFKVIAFALEVQYWDFLEPLRNASQTVLAFRAKAAASQSRSPKGSIGISTGSQQANDTTTV